MLSMAPGVNVISGYTATGGGKTQISINGVKQGWHIPGGAIDDGSIATAFDGVPMDNVATGLWASPDVNQSSLISGIQLTYGLLNLGCSPPALECGIHCPDTRSWTRCA